VKYLREILPGAVVHHSPGEFGMSGKAIARQIAKNKANGMLPGFPDIIVLFQGRTLAMEVKAEGNVLTPAQKALRAEIEAQGVPFAVVRSRADVNEFLAAVGIEFRGPIS
jgi:hypothetical protein